MAQRTYNSELAATLEAMLYSKASALVEQVRLQEAAALLNEADPKPRVEKDHRGLPVVPSSIQYAEYFRDMAAAHIQDQLKNARARWQAAEVHAQKSNQEAEADRKSEAKIQAAKLAAAEVKALGLEIRAAQQALKSKQSAIGVLKKKQLKKRNERNKHLHDIVKHTAHGLSGGSPLAALIAHHLTKHLLKTNEA